MYPFVELGALIALLGAVTFVDGARGRGWWCMALGTALALGSHYYGGFVGVSIVSIALASLAFGRASAVDAAMMASAPLLALLAWTPWLVSALPAQMKTDWAFQSRLGAADLVQLPARFVLVQLSAIPESWRWIGYVIGAPLLLGFALAIVRCLGTLRLEHLWILLAFAGPIATALVLALVVPPSFGPRYLVVAAPAAVLMIALGLDAIDSASVRNVLSGVAIGGALGLALLHKTANEREDYRSACAELAEQWRSDDAVVAISGTPEIFSQAPLRHYLRDRKDVLASIVDFGQVSGSLREFFAPHQRVHAIYREAGYAASGLAAMREQMTLVQTGPMRFRIQHFVFEAAPPPAPSAVAPPAK